MHTPEDIIKLLPEYCVENIITLDTHLVTDRYVPLDVIVNDTYKKISKDVKVIVWNATSEGINFSNSQRLVELSQLLPECKHIHAVGLPALSYYTNHWKKYAKKYNWDISNLYLLLTNYMAVTSANMTKHADLQNIFSTKNKYEKRFIFLNNNHKYHRIRLLGLLNQRNLLNHGYVSYKHSPEKQFENVENLTFPLHLDEWDDIKSENADPYDHMLGMSSSVFSYVEKSGFAIVSETNFLDLSHLNPNDDDEYNQLMNYPFMDHPVNTEKVFKFIGAQRPFIIAGYCGSLDILRQMGFKTFHPYIDETYDQIFCGEDRLNAIAMEVERLCKMSDREFLQLQENIEDILKHNLTVLLNQKKELKLG